MNLQDQIIFNYNYIKAISDYQYAAIQGQNLEFHHGKFMPDNIKDMNIQIKYLQQLQVGLNICACMRLKVIKLTRLNNCTYLLCATKSKQHAPYTLIILIVVNSPIKKEEASVLQQCLLPSTYLSVTHIFLKPISNQKTPVILVASENISIINWQNGQNLEKINFSSDQLRQKGNTFYKKKKYVQAIGYYEQSITQLLGPSRKNRSILYSNSAACFFELRLYTSCIIYAELAIAHDPNYNKGYYRKINALLQLKKFKEIIPLFAKINTLISKSDFQSISMKYTEYMATQNGIINWLSIIKGTNTPQSQYYSTKIQKVRSEDEIQYYAKQNIKKYEIILINKPLIYIKQANQKFKQSFINFLKEIQNYYLYDRNFEQSIHQLPCKCHPTLNQRQLYYNHYKNKGLSLPKKQLFNKMQRCIFEQKSLDKSQDANGYGIWKQMFYLQNRCVPNCTAVHINSYLIINALVDIEKGDPLSIDLIADVQSGKRKQTLNIKFDVQCGCEICQFKQSKDIQFYKIQQLYDRFQRFEVSKLKKQHIWSIINYEWQDREVYQSQFRHLIEYYVYQIQKQCQWDDVLNLLRLKEENDNCEINNHIDEALKRQIGKFLKIEPNKLDEVYNEIIIKYMKDSQDD